MTTRRSFFGRMLATLAAGAAGTGAARAAGSGVPKVVYHLSDADKVGFAIGNIENHVEGEGGRVEIVLVVNGPALMFFRNGAATADMTRRLSRLVASGIGLAACGNTLKAQKLEVADLLPGFVRADEGGVVRLARLQAEGYAYIRP